MNGVIGQVKLFAGNFAPRSWAFCNGQLLAISSNNALFSIIGTAYGGDGRTTFALPDLRGRVAISEGTGPGLTSRRLGSKGGTETVTLNHLEIPSHNHAAAAIIKTPCFAEKGSEDTPVENYLANDAGRPNEFNDTADSYMAPFNNHVLLENTGGSQAHSNMPPYLTMHYIICLQGIYPSRS
ncbi:phage tail protein [Marinifilum flexuosum]|uniref:Microcystin-dependent protein n=1 Tax=Marinifilum flexuosum TaxID=1117708 RepID=A0A419X6C5_9BACT|nr:tail fiber protein [Marinifilum flexuosum]RKE03277.1 microcystin-dependent protein [Marinifilum flexuosum]